MNENISLTTHRAKEANGDCSENERINNRIEKGKDKGVL